MPTTGAVPAPEAIPIQADVARLVGLIRQMRAECQNLQRSLDAVKAAAAQTGPDALRAMVAACLANNQIFEKDRTDINNLLRAMHEVLELNSAMLLQYGDAVTEIENRWDRAVFHWPTGSEDAAELTSRLATVDQELANIVYSCARHSIPERLNELLRRLPVGKALDFHQMFLEELPGQEHRKNMLDYLSRQPKLVEGVVNASQGLIFAISRNPWRMRMSVVYFLIALGLPVPLLWIYSRMGGWFPNQGRPGVPGDFARLSLAYLALAVGSLAHMAIMTLKQVRSGTSQSVAALEDWILWFHVKETPIVTGVLTLWFALVGCAVTLPGAPFATTFFLGYSLDSCVDLFLQRFETIAAKTTEGIRGKLAPAA